MRGGATSPVSRSRSPISAPARVPAVRRRWPSRPAWSPCSRSRSATATVGSARSTCTATLAAPLDDKAMATAQTLADVAAAYLRATRATRAELVRSAAHATDATLHDPLTGLPNRLPVHGPPPAHDRRSASGPATVVTVLYVDLDDFKSTNDAFGHQAGDALLCAIADRLVQHCRPADTVARLAGDEFAVLYEHRIGHCRRRRSIADRLRRRASVSRSGSGEVFVDAEASIGVAFSRLERCRCRTGCSTRRTSRCTRRSVVAARSTRCSTTAEYDRRAERAALAPRSERGAREGARSAACTNRSSRRRPVGSMRWRRCCAGTHPTRGQHLAHGSRSSSRSRPN